MLQFTHCNTYVIANMIFRVCTAVRSSAIVDFLLPLQSIVLSFPPQNFTYNFAVLCCWPISCIWKQHYSTDFIPGPLFQSRNHVRLACTQSTSTWWINIHCHQQWLTDHLPCINLWPLFITYCFDLICLYMVKYILKWEAKFTFIIKIIALYVRDLKNLHVE
jgi:hypothetical protein